METEAYAIDDPASHSFAGLRARNAAMFGAPGDIYVYRIYGVHLCANIVCRPGHAVLLRAIEPTEGEDAMIARRHGVARQQLCAGPGKLCAALGIDLDANGRSVLRPPFEFTPAQEEVALVEGPRIGISKAKEMAWRFGLRGSAFLSRPFPRPNSD